MSSACCPCRTSRSARTSSTSPRPSTGKSSVSHLPRTPHPLRRPTNVHDDLPRPGVRLGLGWNRGAPPPSLQGQLTDRFATTDHLYDPACRGGTRSDVPLAATATSRVGAAAPRAQAATPRVSGCNPAWPGCNPTRPGRDRMHPTRGTWPVRIRPCTSQGCTRTTAYHPRCCSWPSLRRVPAFNSGRRPRSHIVVVGTVPCIQFTMALLTMAGGRGGAAAGVGHIARCAVPR